MNDPVRDYQLEVLSEGGYWNEYWSTQADTDAAAEKFAIAYLEERRPDEGSTFRLIKLIGEVEVTYRTPPPPPEPEMEQLTFG